MSISKKLFFIPFFSIILLSGCLATMNGGSRGSSAEAYNPCDGIIAKIGVDTLVGAVAGGLANRSTGAGYGAAAGLGGGYAMRSAQCESFLQQQAAMETARAQQREAEARQNAGRCQYSEQNGKVQRYCTETVTGNWRR